MGYGAKPSFEFTVKAPNPRDRESEKQMHASLVTLLSQDLDQFVDDVEAQAALDRLVATVFPDRGVTATIKPLFTTTPTVSCVSHHSTSSSSPKMMRVRSSIVSNGSACSTSPAAIVRTR